MDRRENLADRPGAGEVGRGLAAEGRVEALLAVQGAAVEQPVHVSLGVVRHPHDAEEVALDVEQPAAHARRQAAGRQHRGGHEREPDRPPPRRHAGIESQARGDHHAEHAHDRIGQPRLVGRQDRRQQKHDAGEEQVAQPFLERESTRSRVERRRDQARQDHRQGILDHPVEDERSNQRVEDPAQETAQGDGDVKRARHIAPAAATGQRAVAGDGPDEKRQQMERNPRQVDEPGAHDQHQRHDDKGKCPRARRGPRPPSTGRRPG